LTGRLSECGGVVRGRPKNSGAARTGRTSQPKTQIVDAQSRVTLTPDGGTAGVRQIVPATTAKNPVGAVDTGIVQVPAPLPHVAEGVVQPPGVGLQETDLLRATFGVGTVPRDHVQILGPHARAHGPAGMFPLGLGRKTVTVGASIPDDVEPVGIVSHRIAGNQPGGLRELIAKPYGVQPGNIGDRRTWSARKDLAT